MQNHLGVFPGLPAVEITVGLLAIVQDHAGLAQPTSLI